MPTALCFRQLCLKVELLRKKRLEGGLVATVIDGSVLETAKATVKWDFIGLVKLHLFAKRLVQRCQSLQVIDFRL